ncbi:MAG: hypothetical protein ABI632_09790 [Pseudolysinimonas sp.]
MDAQQIRSALESDVLDAGLIHFGHADYIRDYLMYFYHSTYDANVIPHWVDRYRFVNCVLAETATSLPPDTWTRSLGDELIGDPDALEPVNGWVWGTRFGDMYPGATMIERSDDAERWTEALGIPFYEVVVEAPPIRVRLVFSDLVVERAEPGESPFTVERPLGG